MGTRRPAALRRALRVVGIATLGVGGGLTLLLITSLAVAGPDWTWSSIRSVMPEDSLADRFGRSSIARSWRCRGVDRPILQRAKAWTLHYSWTGGYGNGDVFLEVRSDASARLSLHEHGKSPRVSEVILPKDAVDRLAEVVDETRVLCLEPLRRDNHQIVDLGRYTITVEEEEASSRTVYAGQCYYVSDHAAFNEVLSAIYDLEPHFAERLRWGPFGTSTLSTPCK